MKPIARRDGWLGALVKQTIPKDYWNYRLLEIQAKFYQACMREDEYSIAMAMADMENFTKTRMHLPKYS